MEAQCIDVEKIGEVVDLPQDHPQRAHAQACPRCRSLVESYLEFMKAEPIGGSGVDRARGVLDAGIRAGAERWIPASTPASPMSREPWWRALLRPAPLLASAVVIVAAVFLWTSRSPEQSILRDDATQRETFSPQAARVDADGTIHLSWTPMPSADAYQVRIYGPDLGEIYRLPDTAATSAVVARSALPADLPATLDLTWRVYALAAGDVVEVSAPGSIRSP